MSPAACDVTGGGEYQNDKKNTIMKNFKKKYLMLMVATRAGVIHVDPRYEEGTSMVFSIGLNSYKYSVL